MFFGDFSDLEPHNHRVHLALCVLRLGSARAAPSQTWALPKPSGEGVPELIQAPLTLWRVLQTVAKGWSKGRRAHQLLTPVSCRFSGWSSPWDFHWRCSGCEVLVCTEELC